MGLLDFVKNAGKKIFGNDEEEAKAKAAADAKARDAARELINRRRADALVGELTGHGIEIADLAIRVNGNVATISGTAANQADREKAMLAIGNVYGIERVEDNLEVAETEPEAVFYTVVSGDNLSKIAKAHYGKSSKYHAIFEANKPMLEHPDKIYPGQVLRIPALDD